MEVDHVIPLHKGGPDDDTNLQGLCGGCHKAKTATDMGYRPRISFGAQGQPIGSHHWNDVGGG